MTKRKTGTREWSDISYNIQTGCANGCRYCYARYEDVVRWNKATAEAWKSPVVNAKKAAKKWRKEDGVIMFPTRHDIDEGNVGACIEALTNMLSAGNRVLIVTKPRLECVKRMCEALDIFRTGFVFRFTIGTTDDEFLKAFEPLAPPFAERYAALQYAHDNFFLTSISVEPRLCDLGGLEKLLSAVVPLVTDTVWIGKMNAIDRRVDRAGIEDKVAAVESWQTDDEVLKAHAKFGKLTKVRWKDSYREVLDRHGVAG